MCTRSPAAPRLVLRARAEDAMKMISIVLATAALAACPHEKKPDPGPTTKQDPPPGKVDDNAVKRVTRHQPVSPGLAMSGDLVQMCGIKPADNANPTFDYDKDELT